jgi:hypothetical protein
MVKRSLILSIVLIALFLPLTGNCTTLTASTSRSQISLEESVTLTLTAEGSVDEDPDLTGLNNDFEVIGRSQSSNISYINGSMSRTKVWSIELLPRHVGTITIAPICTGNSCSPATTLVVTEQPTHNQSAAVLLEATVSAPTVVAQAQLIYTLRIFMRQPLIQGSLSEISPQGVETSVYKLGEDIRYETQREGWRYQVIERNYALFPQHSGELILPALRLDGIINSTQRTSRFTSAFDLIDQQGQRLRLRSKEIKVTVTEPAQHPAQQPWLPAQKLTINDDWQNTPPPLTVGEPATRSITIAANGLAAASLPELPLAAPANCKIYPDQSLRQDEVSTTGITGTLTQKVAMVPTTAGTFTLPELSMHWWSVIDEQWRTATVPALSIKVLPAQRSAIHATLPPAPPTEPAPGTTPTNQPPTPDTYSAAPPELDHPAPAVENAKDFSTSIMSPHNIWLWISLVCIGGWLATIIFFRRQHKKRNQASMATTATTAKNPSTQKGLPPSTNPSKGRVISCAQANQAAETRRALNEWIGTLDYGKGKLSWDDFLLLVEEPLRLELLALDQHLYTSQGNDTWEGAGLAQELEQWQAPALNGEKTAEKTLPSFYPQG